MSVFKRKTEPKPENVKKVEPENSGTVAESSWKSENQILADDVYLAAVEYNRALATAALAGLFVTTGAEQRAAAKTVSPGESHFITYWHHVVRVSEPHVLPGFEQVTK